MPSQTIRIGYQTTNGIANTDESKGAIACASVGEEPTIAPIAMPRDQASAMAKRISTRVTWNACKNSPPDNAKASTIDHGDASINGLISPSAITACQIA